MPAPEEPSRLLQGRYEIIALSGDGGMAKVYRAVTRGAAGFQRPIAIKRIHEQLSNNTEFVRMFIEEARVCSELDHPNIVQVHDFGVDRDGYFLIMEWVDGLHLGQYVQAFQQRGERTPYRHLAAAAAQVLAGLAEAHERIGRSGEPAPVIHRDVTPQNILLSVTGVAKLTDFGLSRAMDRARMTNPDVVKGKLSYLAPELVQGMPATVQSDLYGLGIVLWEALTGERLFWADSDAERVRKVRAAAIPPLSSRRDDLPESLVRVVHQALQADPRARFACADDMARALLRVTGDEPVSARGLGRSVMDARVTLGMQPRTPRAPQAPGPTTSSRGVRTMRTVVLKPNEE